MDSMSDQTCVRQIILLTLGRNFLSVDKSSLLLLNFIPLSIDSEYIGRIYTDSLVHDEKALKFLIDTIGEVSDIVKKSSAVQQYVYFLSTKTQSNVILGSDYPFPLGEHHPGKLIESIEDWKQELKVS